MGRVLLTLFLLLAARLAAGTPWDDALSHAQIARARLGDDAWSQIIAIQNSSPDEIYPARLPALVFEVGQRLWLYVPGVGTESLSLAAGQLARDRADLQPLLRAAHAGFQAHEILTPAPAPTGARPPRTAPLPQGCFIDAVARWHELRRDRARATHGRLIALYPTGPGFGHTVLYYEQAGRAYVFDPDRPHRDLRYPPARARDARSIALFILEQSPGARLARAQSLALTEPTASAPTFLARLEPVTALAPPVFAATPAP
jgi:hypothetical protein